MSSYQKNPIRLISAVVIGCFLLQDAAWAAPTTLAPSPITAAATAQAAISQFALNPSQLQIPLQAVTLQEVHVGTNGRLIIHIQDAHANLSGQQSLAKALDHFMSQYDLKVVLVEGSARDSSLDEIRKLAPIKEWQIIARRFLYDGIISGEEYLNLTTEHPMKILGIEYRDLYDESIRAYASLVDRRNDILHYLYKSKVSLDRLKAKFYTREIRDYEAKKGADDSGLTDFKTGFSNLLELADKAGYPLTDLPNTQKLKSLLDKEKTIRFDQANAEQQKILESLSASGAASDVKEFIEASKRLKTSQVSQYLLIKNLFKTAEDKKLALDSMPELKAYERYLSEFLDLKLDSLLAELDLLEDRVYEQLLPSEDARKVRAIDRFLGLLGNAYKLQMSSRDFGMFTFNEKDFPTESWLAFMNQKLAELGFFESMIPYQKYLEDARKDFGKFYELVGQRDQAFVENAARLMKEQNTDAAILIAGGYHTAHLTELLRQEGTSYVVLTPVVTDTTDHERYEELLLQHLKQQEKKLSGNKDTGAYRAQNVAATKIPRGLRQLEALGSRLANLPKQDDDFARSRVPGLDIPSAARALVGKRPEAASRTDLGRPSPEVADYETNNPYQAPESEIRKYGFGSATKLLVAYFKHPLLSALLTQFFLIAVIYAPSEYFTAGSESRLVALASLNKHAFLLIYSSVMSVLGAPLLISSSRIRVEEAVYDQLEKWVEDGVRKPDLTVAEERVLREGRALLGELAGRFETGFWRHLISVLKGLLDTDRNAVMIRAVEFLKAHENGVETTADLAGSEGVYAASRSATHPAVGARLAKSKKQENLALDARISDLEDRIRTRFTMVEPRIGPAVIDLFERAVRVKFATALGAVRAEYCRTIDVSSIRTRNLISHITLMNSDGPDNLQSYFGRGTVNSTQMQAFIVTLEDLTHWSSQYEDPEFWSWVGQFTALTEQRQSLNSAFEPINRPLPLATEVPGGLFYDLASGPYFRNFLQSLNAKQKYFAIDMDPFVVAYLNEWARIYGVEDRFSAVRSDVMRWKKPAEPVGVVRIKNVWNYVDGFGSKLDEVLGTGVTPTEPWIMPGGALLLQTDSESDHHQLLSSINSVNRQAQILIGSGWSFEGYLDDPGLVYALDQMIFRRPQAGEEKKAIRSAGIMISRWESFRLKVLEESDVRRRERMRMLGGDLFGSLLSGFLSGNFSVIDSLDVDFIEDDEDDDSITNGARLAGRLDSRNPFAYSDALEKTAGPGARLALTQDDSDQSRIRTVAQRLKMLTFYTDQAIRSLTPAAKVHSGDLATGGVLDKSLHPSDRKLSGRLVDLSTIRHDLRTIKNDDVKKLHDILSELAILATNIKFGRIYSPFGAVDLRPGSTVSQRAVIQSYRTAVAKIVDDLGSLDLGRVSVALTASNAERKGQGMVYEEFTDFDKANALRMMGDLSAELVRIQQIASNFSTQTLGEGARLADDRTSAEKKLYADINAKLDHAEEFVAQNVIPEINTLNRRLLMNRSSWGTRTQDYLRAMSNLIYNQQGARILPRHIRAIRPGAVNYRKSGANKDVFLMTMGIDYTSAGTPTTLNLDVALALKQPKSEGDEIVGDISSEEARRYVEVNRKTGYTGVVCPALLSVYRDARTGAPIGLVEELVVGRTVAEAYQLTGIYPDEEGIRLIGDVAQAWTRASQLITDPAGQAEGASGLRGNLWIGDIHANNIMIRDESIPRENFRGRLVTVDYGRRQTYPAHFVHDLIRYYIDQRNDHGAVGIAMLQDDTIPADHREAVRREAIRSLIRGIGRGMLNRGEEIRFWSSVMTDRRRETLLATQDREEITRYLNETGLNVRGIRDDEKKARPDDQISGARLARPRDIEPRPLAGRSVGGSISVQLPADTHPNDYYKNQAGTVMVDAETIVYGGVYASNPLSLRVVTLSDEEADSEAPAAESIPGDMAVQVAQQARVGAPRHLLRVFAPDSATWMNLPMVPMETDNMVTIRRGKVPFSRLTPDADAAQRLKNRLRSIPGLRVNDPDSLQVERVYIDKNDDGTGAERVYLDLDPKEVTEPEKTNEWRIFLSFTDPDTRKETTVLLPRSYLTNAVSRRYRTSLPVNIAKAEGFRDEPRRVALEVTREVYDEHQDDPNHPERGLRYLLEQPRLNAKYFIIFPDGNQNDAIGLVVNNAYQYEVHNFGAKHPVDVHRNVNRPVRPIDVDENSVYTSAGFTRGSEADDPIREIVKSGGQVEPHNRKPMDFEIEDGRAFEVIARGGSLQRLMIAPDPGKEGLRVFYTWNPDANNGAGGWDSPRVNVVGDYLPVPGMAELSQAPAYAIIIQPHGFRIVPYVNGVIIRILPPDSRGDSGANGARLAMDRREFLGRMAALSSSMDKLVELGAQAAVAPAAGDAVAADPFADIGEYFVQSALQRMNLGAELSSNEMLVPGMARQFEKSSGGYAENAAAEINQLTARYAELTGDNSESAIQSFGNQLRELLDSDIQSANYMGYILKAASNAARGVLDPEGKTRPIRRTGGMMDQNGQRLKYLGGIKRRLKAFENAGVEAQKRTLSAASARLMESARRQIEETIASIPEMQNEWKSRLGGDAATATSSTLPPHELLSPPAELPRTLVDETNETAGDALRELGRDHDRLGESVPIAVSEEKYVMGVVTGEAAGDAPPASQKSSVEKVEEEIGNIGNSVESALSKRFSAPPVSLGFVFNVKNMAEDLEKNAAMIRAVARWPVPAGKSGRKVFILNPGGETRLPEDLAALALVFESWEEFNKIMSDNPDLIFAGIMDVESIRDQQSAVKDQAAQLRLVQVSLTGMNKKTPLVPVAQAGALARIAGQVKSLGMKNEDAVNAFAEIAVDTGLVTAGQTDGLAGFLLTQAESGLSAQEYFTGLEDRALRALESLDKMLGRLVQAARMAAISA